eukprot:624642-Rhodomonas_salina.2
MSHLFSRCCIVPDDIDVSSMQQRVRACVRGICSRTMQLRVRVRVVRRWCRCWVAASVLTMLHRFSRCCIVSHDVASFLTMLHLSSRCCICPHDAAPGLTALMRVRASGRQVVSLSEKRRLHREGLAIEDAVLPRTPAQTVSACLLYTSPSPRDRG